MVNFNVVFRDCSICQRRTKQRVLTNGLRCLTCLTECLQSRSDDAKRSSTRPATKQTKVP